MRRGDYNASCASRLSGRGGWPQLCARPVCSLPLCGGDGGAGRAKGRAPLTGLGPTRRAHHDLWPAALIAVDTPTLAPPTTLAAEGGYLSAALAAKTTSAFDAHHHHHYVGPQARHYFCIA